MKFAANTIFDLAVIGLVAISIYTGRNWPSHSTRLLPWLVGFPTLVLSVINLLQGLVRERGNREEISQNRTNADPDRLSAEPNKRPHELADTLRIWGWLAGFTLGICLIGFFYTVPLFVFIFTKVEARTRWSVSFLYTALTVLFVYILFGRLLDVLWPPGILFG